MTPTVVAVHAVAVGCELKLSAARLRRLRSGQVNEPLDSSILAACAAWVELAYGTEKVLDAPAAFRNLDYPPEIIRAVLAVAPVIQPVGS